MPVSGRSLAPAAIDLRFAPNATMQENVTEIKITVSYTDSDEILETRLVNVGDTDRTEQFIEISIQLPVATPLNLTVTAFESDCPLFEFREEIEIDPDEDDPIIIPVELSPLQMVFSMSSEQDRINLGDTYILDVYAQNANKLVGFVCDIEFDENLLELLKIEAGTLLADKTALLNLADYLDIAENNSSPVALGFTERADTGERICGSGSLFRLSFRTKERGTANFRILHDSVEIWALRDGDFAEVRDSEQVKIVTEYSVVIE